MVDHGLSLLAVDKHVSETAVDSLACRVSLYHTNVLPTDSQAIKLWKLLSRRHPDTSIHREPLINRGTLIRIISIDKAIGQFYNQGVTIISLGCGYDTRATYLTHLNARFIYVDMPSVIALHRRFCTLPEERLLEGDLRDKSWWDLIHDLCAKDKISSPPSSLILILIECVLMYLDDECMEHIFTEIAALNKSTNLPIKMLLFEPVCKTLSTNGVDHFANQMAHNLDRSLGARCLNVDKIKSTLAKHNFLIEKVQTMLELEHSSGIAWNNLCDKKELQLDEREEWVMMANHYALITSTFTKES